jgi:hypothetical protein
MVHSTGEERAVHLTREAVELVDAGHREVRVTPLFDLNHTRARAFDISLFFQSPAAL